ncbi:hypothetical protein HOE67_02520 [Candidatus Peregrinibacteria bacterium]|nr:hypothetical protein [Candidatus Peregrinibacteria bacterium]
MPLIDIQFIQLWAPAITPPNDDAIYGKNLLKEWDKFIKRGHPYGISNSGVTQLLEYSTELAADIAYSKVTPDSDFTSLLQDINEIQSFVTKDQVDNIEQFEIISKGEDFIVYSQSVMAEIKTMTMYFKNFMNMFKEIGEEICPSIAEKPYKD